MKTPMQELIEQLLRYRARCERWADIKQEGCAQIYYTGMVDVLVELEISIINKYLDKERQIIEEAFLDGYTHSPDEGFPEYARDYYNEKFSE